MNKKIVFGIASALAFAAWGCSSDDDNTGDKSDAGNQDEGTEDSTPGTDAPDNDAPEEPEGPMLGGIKECDDCLKTNCPDEYQACATDDACTKRFECTVCCDGNECLDECIGSVGGEDLANALGNCAGNKCGGKCTEEALHNSPICTQ